MTTSYSKLERLAGSVRTILIGRESSAAAVQSVLTKLLVLALNAFTSIVVARVLRPEGRGEMSALIMWSGFLTGLFTLGMPSSLVYNLRRKRAAENDVVGTALAIALALSIVIGVIGEIAVPFWLKHYSARDIYYARWFLISSPIPMFVLVGRAAMEARGKFAASNMVLWSGPFFTLIALLFLGLFHALSPLTGGLAYVLGPLPSLLWLLKNVWMTYAPRFSKSMSVASDLFHYGLRSWGIDLLNALSGQADVVLIVRFLNAEAMGIYVVAASLARLLSIFQTSAVMILFPRIAGRDRPEILSVTGQALRVTTMCAALGAVAVGTVGPALLSAIYGPEYGSGGTAVFRILLAEVVLAGATQILAQAFMASGRPGVVTIVQAIGVGVGISLMPMLILKFGVLGAGLAILLSTSIRLSLTLLCFKPLLKARAPALVITREDMVLLGQRIARFVPALPVAPAIGETR